LAAVITMLRLMRLLRILRLIKLMKAIRPLYRLMSGVVQSLRAMQWVLVLSLLVLYAKAIFWTTVVGHGLAYGGDEHTPDKAKDAFGTVPRSLFSLFCMMNGEFGMADEEVFPYMWGQIIFVMFMVVASWALLAILTSVVSDHMIASSQKQEEEDDQKKKLEQDETMKRRLKQIFEQFDQEGDGIITEQEWRDIMSDPGIICELQEVVGGATKEWLEEVFKDLSTPQTSSGKNKLRRSSMTSMKRRLSRGKNGEPPRILRYDAFIDFMQTRDSPANQQGIHKLLARLEHLEAEVWKAAEVKAYGSESAMRGETPRESGPGFGRQPTWG